MATSSTSASPQKDDLQPKNRVWDFFGERPRFAYQIDPQALETHRVPQPNTTAIASDIPLWLSRDPIGERGGVNLYGFVGNDGVNKRDYLGLDPSSGGFGFCGPKKIKYDKSVCCCLDGKVVTTKFVTDAAGARCLNCEITIIELRIDDSDWIGHAFLVVDGIGYGHYPKDLENEGGTYGKGPGHTTKMDLVHPFNPAQTTKYDVCPKTVRKLIKSINDNLNKDYQAANITANNCAGWVCEMLENAGIDPPGGSDNPLMRPQDLRPGGLTGLR